MPFKLRDFKPSDLKDKIEPLISLTEKDANYQPYRRATQQQDDIIKKSLRRFESVSSESSEPEEQKVSSGQTQNMSSKVISKTNKNGVNRSKAEINNCTQKHKGKDPIGFA